MHQSPTSNAPGTPASPSRFSPKKFTVVAPSGHVYELRELSSYEQMQADGVALSTAEAIYYRMGLSIDTIDGQAVPPRPKKDFVDLLLKDISGQDGDALVLAYAKEFSPEAQAGSVKN